MNDCVASMAEALLKKNSRATMKLTEKVYVCILQMLHIYKGDTDVHFLLYLEIAYCFYVVKSSCI